MRFEEFINQVTEAVEGQIPQDLKDVITVSHNEVIKNNDKLLHGISLSVPGHNCMPTIYLEECFEAYEKGLSIEELAKAIIGISRDAYTKAPQLSEISLEYENVKNNLVVQLIDGDMNKERLKTLVYREVGNGFAMIAYIVMAEEAGGYMRTAVTKAMAEEFNYDEKTVMDIALLNTMERFKPAFSEVAGLCIAGQTPEIINPLEESFERTPLSGMFVLSNTAYLNGASTFFYPFVAERLSEILDDNYYVLPSSIHELIIVPERMGFEAGNLKQMVREVNKRELQLKDILSDKVLYYDRGTNGLIEPKLP